MYVIQRSGRFKKDFKTAKKRGHDLDKLKSVIVQLQQGKTLELYHRDHPLKGNWSCYRECHITPDWLLIYRIHHHILELVRTGSHSDLFKK